MSARHLQIAAAAFTVRARGAGHPVLTTRPGRWAPTVTVFAWSPQSVDGEITPNDWLDMARETARGSVEWVHALLPTYADALRLSLAVQPAPVAAVPRQ